MLQRVRLLVKVKDDAFSSLQVGKELQEAKAAYILPLILKAIFCYYSNFLRLSLLGVMAIIIF